MSNLKQVVPGIAVSNEVKITISHPDPCWVIHNPEKTATRSIGNGDLLIFTEEKKAEGFMGNNDRKSYIIKSYTWSELVEKFKNQFKNAVIDHEGKESWYENVPIRDDI